MHVHLPKPLRVWREFAGEVGIIVIGVLIALGAEQVVDLCQWREKVDRAEGAMRIELGSCSAQQAKAEAGRPVLGFATPNPDERRRTNPRSALAALRD